MSGEHPVPAPATPPSLQMLGDAGPACEDGVCAVAPGPAAHEDALPER